MDKRNRRKERLLRVLEETPLIEHACRKVGIGRQTFYNWCEVDKKFYYRSEAARLKGREKLNDFTESKLVENIKNGNQRSIEYWLTNNSKTYRQRRATPTKELEQELVERNQEALRLFTEGEEFMELISMNGGDPEILGEAIKEAMKGRFQWLVKHDDV